MGTADGFVTTGQWQRGPKWGTQPRRQRLFFVYSLPQALSESTEEREKASMDSEAIR